MTNRERTLQGALARLVGQVRGAGLRDQLGHTFTRNAALYEAEQLIKSLDTLDQAYVYAIATNAGKATLIKPPATA